MLVCCKFSSNEMIYLNTRCMSAVQIVWNFYTTFPPDFFNEYCTIFIHLCTPKTTIIQLKNNKGYLLLFQKQGIISKNIMTGYNDLIWKKLRKFKIVASPCFHKMTSNSGPSNNTLSKYMSSTLFYQYTTLYSELYAGAFNLKFWFTNVVT